MQVGWQAAGGFVDGHGDDSQPLLLASHERQGGVYGSSSSSSSSSSRGDGGESPLVWPLSALSASEEVSGEQQSLLGAGRVPPPPPQEGLGSPSGKSEDDFVMI